MILDHIKIIEKESKNWNTLETFCTRMEEDTGVQLSYSEIRQFYYLYRKAVNALAYLKETCAAQSYIEMLEAIVGRAYAIIYSGNKTPARIRWFSWFFNNFPVVFRRHLLAFGLSFVTMLSGSLFGIFVLSSDIGLKTELLPFGHGELDPVKRVKTEEASLGENIKGNSATFSAFLMRNNISVSIRSIAFGMTFGIGTLVLLFYNGIIMGGICTDYIVAAQGTFLAGWLLPHGSIEIPAILIAGQAGFVIAGTLFGFKRERFRKRLKTTGMDVVILTGGIAVMLVWAGIIEAFFSQYHEPIIPYWTKILFGVIELLALAFFLSSGGRSLKHENR
jgi:uncharacterized membrane protein SpoIIM required for sporulation